jgi:hypothetical protein
MKMFSLILLLSLGASFAGEAPKNLERKNLVAWCIVPFDAKQRTPAERAAMLKELGIGRCAYDWRAEHVPEFEEEILQYKKHGIDYFAFWGGHEEALKLFEKHGLHPQIWQTAPSPQDGTQEEKIAAAAQSLQALAKRAADLGCKLGLYNHGGWGGEPTNLVAVCQRLHELGHDHVGIVYNLHHGHEHIADFAEVLTLMKPHLLCLNINGMNANAQPKILSIGNGAFEADMIAAIIESGYSGPIGILDHRNEMDSEVSLRENIEGLKKVLAESK